MTTDRTPTITINYNESCKRCGQPGATKSGYCLRCVRLMMVARLKDEAKQRRKKHD